MFEIEHHCNLAEITGRPGLSWSVCKTLHINHIKDTADEQISSAGRKLAALEKVLAHSWHWRHRDVYLPLQMAVGRASTSPTMPVPFPQSPTTQQCFTITNNIHHHQSITQMLKAGRSYTHTRCFGLIWKRHDFPQIMQKLIFPDICQQLKMRGIVQVA